MNRTESLAPPRYEPVDASPRYIILGCGVLALGVALSLLVSALLYRESDQSRRVFSTEQSFRHGPAEKTGIARDWAEQDRLVEEHLHGYGWVDRPAGIVHVPVDRALDLIASEAATKTEEKHP